jgi:hypothetical protein
MLNKENAGKTKNYAAIANMIKEVQAPVQDISAVATRHDAPAETDPVRDKNMAMANSVVDMVRANADHTIQKKRHAMYKGERLPRTYLIKPEVDERMRRVAEKNNIKLQGIVEMAIVEFLDKHYPKD